MKTPRVTVFPPSLVWILAISGCHDSPESGSSDGTPQKHLPETEQVVVEYANKFIESKVEWRDSITKDGRIARLFQAPAPIPDETKRYHVEEGESLFAIVLARFDSTWIGSVINLSAEDPIRQFERSSADECLTAIQSEFRFTKAIKKSPECAFP